MAAPGRARSIRRGAEGVAKGRSQRRPRRHRRSAAGGGRRSPERPSGRGRALPRAAFCAGTRAIHARDWRPSRSAGCCSTSSAGRARRSTPSPSLGRSAGRLRRMPWRARWRRFRAPATSAAAVSWRCSIGDFIRTADEQRPCRDSAGSTDGTPAGIDLALAAGMHAASAQRRVRPRAAARIDQHRRVRRGAGARGAADRRDRAARHAGRHRARRHRDPGDGDLPRRCWRRWRSSIRRRANRSSGRWR